MAYTRGTVTPFTAKAEKLLSGEFLNLPRNNIKDRTHLSFTCDLGELSEDSVIRFGHGFECSCGSWVEITKKTVAVCNFYSWHDPKQSYPLPVTEMENELSDFLTVSLTRDSREGTFLTVMSAKGMQKFTLGKIAGDIGEPFASPLGCEITNCKLNFLADGYADPIWVFGDSYLSFPDPARWPTYIYRDSFEKVLLAGYSGMSTQRGLEDFKLAITKGTPVYAVWCLGMNNGDKTEEPNPDWLAATEEFLAICKEKGIIPILSTIPTTPIANNNYKNEWVRNSGYRYIDFNRAVGSHKDNAWYPEMLYKDNVHPARSGGEALYAQVLVDFPEIMKR